MVDRCAECNEVFEKRHSKHVVCENPECKKIHRKRRIKAASMSKEEFQAKKQEQNDVFTDVIREVIILCLEYRKPALDVKQIARQVGRSEEGTAQEIERMRQTREYDRVKRIVGLQRGKV